MSKLIDLTGKQFNDWLVLSRAENDKRGRARWLCKCLLCGQIKTVDGCHLRDGSSKNCGCQKMNKMKEANVKDETGKRYGKLTVIKRAPTPEGRAGAYWTCQCDCGTILDVKGDYLRNGDTSSCGCILSKNEARINQMLDKLKYIFKKQYYFDDLYTNNKKDKLLFDFAIFNNNQLIYLIEYDGIQHFNKEHSWSTDGFFITRKNDLLKNKYCFEHNIPLIRIPFDEKYTIEDLKIETTRFLLTQENEKNYYESRGLNE